MVNTLQSAPSGTMMEAIKTASPCANVVSIKYPSPKAIAQLAQYPAKTKPRSLSVFMPFQ